MTRAVCDTGPLLHLTEADSLSLLEQVGDNHAPPQVIAEMAGLLPDWRIPAWLMVDDLEPSRSAKAASWVQAGFLHAGEAEAIALAQQIAADWLLTDDAGARLFATQLGMEVHGSLGIVLWTAVNGFLDRHAAERSLLDLAASSLWITRSVYAEAQSALDEIYGR